MAVVDYIRPQTYLIPRVLLTTSHRYKGFGTAIIDQKGSKDRKEFYNV